MTEFYNPEGLRIVAQLVQRECENDQQRELASKAKVSPQTIGNLRAHRFSAGQIVRPPNPETILKLAPFVTNPATNQPFAPWDLLALACGVPSITLSPAQAFQIIGCVSMCTASLGMIIRAEFQKQGLDPDNPEHFARLVDGGGGLWTPPDKQEVLKSIINGTFQGTLTQPLLEDCAYALADFSGNSDAYSAERIVERMQQVYQHQRSHEANSNCCI